MLFIILFVVFSFVVVIYLYYSWNYNYWKKRGIPHEEPSFFFGNFKEVLAGKVHFGIPYCDLYKKFENTAYFGFFKLRTPTLVVKDLELIKEVLVKEFNSFAENELHVEPEQEPILSENPAFLRYGEEWRRRRAHWSSGMTMNKIKLMFPNMLDKCDVMTTYLNTHCEESSGKPLEARELVMKYLTDIIVTSVLGLQVNSFQDDQNAFKRIASTGFTTDFWEGIISLIFLIAPWMHYFYKPRFLKKSIEKDLYNISKNIIEIRKENGFHQNGVFEEVLKQENANEVQIIAGRVFGFLSEGIETSSGLISYMLFELASNPHVQTKLREELEEAAAENEGKLTFEKIHSMQYLEMVVLDEMLVELTALFAATALVTYLFFTWNFNYWKKNGIPYEKPKFFFGNFKEAMTGTKHFGLIYNDLYKKFNNAAYFGFFKLGTPSIVIRDLDMIKAVLIKDYNHFAENDFHTDTEKDAILAENPFFHVGELWKAKRARWSIVLTPTKIKGMYGTMEEKSQRMVEYLQNHIRDHPGEPMEARGLAVKYLTDVIVSGVLGLQCNTFADEDNIFKKIALSFFVSDFWEGMSNFAYIIAPWLHKIFFTGFLKKWVKDECLDIAKNIVALKKKNGYTSNDFFETLMKEDGSTEVDVAGRILGFLSEGVETSSSLTSFALYEMAANPQIQAKLRKELNDAAAANNGQLSYDTLHNIKYLDMVLKETMRVYPAVLTINRVCTIPYTLAPAVPGGKPYTIPVGMPVTICNYATHHDPQFFPNPQFFDPERFRDEDNIPKYSYLPFGEGPRICIGMRLGLTNSKVALSAILRNFEVRVSPKTVARPLPIDPTVLIIRTVGDLWITFHQIST